MPVFNNALAGAAGSAGGAADYKIERSLRFNKDDTARLQRSFAAGNTTTWSLSFWVKRGQPSGGDEQEIFNAGTVTNDYFAMRFDAADTLTVFDRPSSGNTGQLTTTQVFRDYSAWYHIVYVWDTTNATPDDRKRLYVNGSRVTTFNTNQAITTSGTQSRWNSNTTHTIGLFSPTNQIPLDCLLADVHFLDGIAISDPDGVFGEFDADTGVWNPIKYSGTYGTNGFHLDFSNNSSNAALGFDANVGGTRYSAYVTGFGSPGPENMFDGDATTSYAVSTTGGRMTFTPPTAIPYTDASGGVEVAFMASASGQLDRVRINGGSWVTQPSGGGWHKVSTGDGSITSMDFEDEGTQEAVIHAIRVNGTILTNPSGANDWTVNNFTAQEGSSNTFIVWGSISNAGSSSSLNVAALGAVTSTPATFWPADSNTYNHLTADFGSVGTYSIHADPFLSDPTANIIVFVSDNGTDWTTIPKGQSPYNFSGRYIQWARTGSGYGAQDLNADTRSDVDSLLDSPTNYEADSGNNGGNYATLNPLQTGSGLTLSNGNLDLDGTSSWKSSYSTIFLPTGKWYSEYTIRSITTHSYGILVGLAGLGTNRIESEISGGDEYAIQNGPGDMKISRNAGSTGLGAQSAYAVGDVLQLAYDADNGKLWFGKNGTYINSGDPSAGSNPVQSGISGTYCFAVALLTASDKISANFGQRAFAHTLPTGFKAVCTTNFDDPLIADGSAHFATKKYTGTGGTTKIGGPVYSNQVTGGSSPTSMFDGSVSSWSNLTAGNTITFTPSPEIACTQLELWLGTDTPIRVNVNGGGYGSTFTQATLGYVDITPSGGMTSLTSLLIDAPAGGTGSGAGIRGLRINGTTIIVDGQDTSTKFKPDLVWIKCRSGSQHHVLTDSVRGTSSQLFSDITNTEGSQTDQVTAFNSDGFSLGANASGTGGVNINTSTYASWLWNGGDLALTGDTTNYNQSQTWSSTVTSSNTSYQFPFATGFDGVVTGDAGTAGFAGWTSNSVTLTFSNLSASSNVVVYAGSGLNGSISATCNIGGTDYTQSASSGYVNTLTFNNTGAVTTLSLTSGGGGVRFYGIKVDGKTLIDPGVIPRGVYNEYEYNQDAIWSSMVSPTPSAGTVVSGFDGNLDTVFAGGINPGSYFTFTPTGGISFTDKIRVRNGAVGGASYKYNNGTATSFPANAWTTVATGGGTMTSFGVTRNTNDVHSWYAIEVDGKILVDSNINADTPSIASTVRSNPTAGFSCLTYSGNSTSGSSVAHSLGKKPDFIIVKARNRADNWLVYHSAYGGSHHSDLNLTGGFYPGNSKWLQDPTSNVFYLNTDSAVNGPFNYVAYAWTAVEGYSAFGTYTGNASDDGPFVSTGFRPAFVMIKCSSTSNSYTNWDINDSARDTYNVADATLAANLDDSENSGNIGTQKIDFLSNGFKIRQQTSSSKNLSGETYIYAAFAENPFKISRAR